MGVGQWSWTLLLCLVVTGCAAPQVRLPQPSRVPSERIRGWDVVIDPGHGGSQLGARGRQGSSEKVITLDIAKRLKRHLERAGVRAMLTRYGDETVTLWRRSHVAKRSGAQAFLSIHANAARNRAASGFEVYYLPGYERYGRSVAFASGAPQTDHSYRLAWLIRAQFQHDWPIQDRGVKQARFYVLRNSSIPAVLVEVGFLTNSHDEALLRDPAVREEIARRIAHAVILYRQR